MASSKPICNLNKNVDVDSLKQTNLVVRIDQDSDDNFQALFDSVLNPGDSKRPLQVPFRMRKLPTSFFNPPSGGSKSPSVSHSRANSTDSAFSNGSQTNVNSATQPQIIIPTNPTGLHIVHSRAHSSPASLQQTYTITSNSSTNQNTTGTVNVVQNSNESSVQPVHIKQRSYDVVSPIQLQNELGALPSGWEQAKTNDGQIYYLNHTTKTTQWEDPRVQLQKQRQAVQRALHQTANTNANKEHPSADPLGPLPEGWEQALTDSGDVYFINHVNRTTSWNDPRIPDFLQKPNLTPRSNINWLNIRNLDKEREYLKQRHLDIQQQDILVRQSQPISLPMDPFLSGLDNHARQESSDSGLSLSSNNFSVNTEFLSQIDDSMDCIGENANINSLNGLDCPDNLVSSLQIQIHHYEDRWLDRDGENCWHQVVTRQTRIRTDTQIYKTQSNLTELNSDVKVQRRDPKQAVEGVIPLRQFELRLTNSMTHHRWNLRKCSIVNSFHE